MFSLYLAANIALNGLQEFVGLNGHVIIRYNPINPNSRTHGPQIQHQRSCIGKDHPVLYTGESHSTPSE